MLVTSSIISVAMSQFLSRNLAPPCCGPASSLVSYTERNRVSGFPGGFPPPFQASLLCTARNSANDLCTPNIQPTFRSETAYRGPLDLKYSIQEDFERSLFRKWLEPSQGRKKSAGRISILSAFAISFKVIILIQGVFEVVVQIVKIKCRHFSNTWLNELSITILIVFILFIVHSTYIFFQIVHHGNFTHLNLLISRILTTLIFLVNLKRLFHLTKLLSHATFRTKDFPFPFSLEQPFRRLETFSMFSMFPWDGSFNYAIKILARRKQHGWKWRSLIEDGWMASIKRTSFARFDNNQSDAPFIRTHWIRNNYPSFPTNQYNVHIEFQFLSPSSLSVSGCNTEHKRDHTFPVTRDWSLIAKTSRIVLVSAIYV